MKRAQGIALHRPMHSIARVFDRGHRRYPFRGRSTNRLPRREAEIETRRRTVEERQWACGGTPG